ncbi:MAG: hypothetical protein QW594_02830 [Candidatus Woesearchaeota archaeon]
MASTFRDTIIFFDKLGIYDVVLPFLLVFSVVYAILDKTRVFGTEQVGDKKTPKRNINAMVAFVTAFFVVASTKLVAAISQAMANVVLVLLLIVMFLMLIGAFFKDGEAVYLKEGAWRTTFMVVVLILIILIFLHAIPTDDGSNWLFVFWGWLQTYWDSTAIASIILLIVLIALLLYITGSNEKEHKKSDHHH